MGLEAPVVGFVVEQNRLSDSYGGGEWAVGGNVGGRTSWEMA